MTSRKLSLLIAGILIVTAAVWFDSQSKSLAVDGKRNAGAAPVPSELWKALEKALPGRFQQIEAYAENPKETEVLFRSRGRTLRFSLPKQKFDEIIHAAVLPTINRITYEKDKDGESSWVLWHNGRRESTIDLRIEGVEPLGDAN